MPIYNSISLILSLLWFCFLPGKALPISPPKRTLYQDMSGAQDRAKIFRIKKMSQELESRKPDSSIKLLQSGLTLSRRLHYRYGEALMISSVGDVNERYRNYTVAFKHQKEALNIFLSLNLTKEAAERQLALGRLFGKMRHLNESNQLLNKCLQAYQKSNDRQGQLRTLLILGNINALNKNYYQAMVFDQLADSLLRNQPISPDHFVLIEHMAQIQENLGNNTKAMEYYEIGISKSDDARFAAWHISLLRSAGELWDKIGDHDNAGILHEQSISKARQFHLPEAEVKSQISLALSLRDSNLLNSIVHLKNALSLSRSIGSSQLTAEIFHSLSDLYQQQAQYKEALTSMRQYQHLLDSIQIVNEGHKLAILEGSYELAENKIHIQNLELTAHQRAAQRNMALVVLISLLIFLGFITFYYLKTKNLNQKLTQSNVTKDRLFSIIGHDLRNPIGGMVQLLDLIDPKGADPEETLDIISLMKQQGNNAFEILNALLNWGESQLKGIKVENTIFKPQYYVQRNIELLDKQIQDKQLHLTSQIPTDLRVLGDVNHFDFIMRNLLSNAIKFSFLGGNIEVLYTGVKGNRIQFLVQDHGKGVSAEQQLQFQNANMDVSFGTRGEKGTGLGLLLSKEFAHANGDKLILKSKEGKGAAFLFSFKLESY